MPEKRQLRESVDELQAMRREIERRLAAAQAAEAARQAAAARQTQNSKKKGQ